MNIEQRYKDLALNEEICPQAKRLYFSDVDIEFGTANTVEEFQVQNSALENALKSAQADADRVYREGMIGKAGIKTGQFIINTALDLAIVTTPASVVAVAITKKLVNAPLDFAIQEMDKNIKVRSGAIFRDHLKTLNDGGMSVEQIQDVVDQMKEDYADGKLVDAQDWFLSQGKGLLEQIESSDLTPEYKKYARTAMLPEVERVLRQGIDVNAALAHHNARDIGEIQRDVKGLFQTQEALRAGYEQICANQENFRVQMQEMEDDIKLMRKDINGLSDDVQVQGRQLNQLSQFFFGTLSPEQQLKFLKTQPVHWMSAKEKAAQVKQLKLRNKQKEFFDTANTVFRGASVISEFLGKTDLIDPKLMGDIQKVARYGQGAVAIAQQLSSGQWINALSTFNGLLGGQKDAASSRHEQVMKALGALLEGQEEIKRGIDDLKRGQQEIMEGLRATFTALENVSKQVATQHAQVMDELRLLNDQQRSSHEVMMNLLTEQLESADVFYRTLQHSINHPRRGYNFKTINHHFRSYYKRFQDVNNTFQNWLNPITKRPFRLSASLSQLNYWHRSKAPEQNLSKLKRQWQLLRDVVVDAAEHQKQKTEQILAMALLPVEKLAFEAKIKRHVEPQHIDKTLSAYSDVLATPIAMQPLIEIAQWVETTHHYHHLIETPASSQMLSLEQRVENLAYYSDVGEDLLELSIRHFDVAIIQYSLFSGMGLIGYAVDILMKHGDVLNTEEDQRRDRLLSLLGYPSVFQRNVVRALLIRLKALNDFDYSQYTYAMRISDNGKYLKELLRVGDGKQPWLLKTVGEDRQWHLEFERAHIPDVNAPRYLLPLPPYERLRDQSFEYTVELKHLFKVRNRLLSIKGDYNLLSRDARLDENERLQLAYALITSGKQPVKNHINSVRNQER